MKTAKINRDEVRETTFPVTVTRPEKKAIQEEANKIGLTMSSWVSMIIGEKINQK